MFKILIAILALFSFTAFHAQVTSITVEAFYTDDGSVANYPAGHTTYRIYANTTTSTDRVTTVSGNSDLPLALSVSGSGIWNYPVGGATGDGSSCLIYGSQPLAEYDSYMTIGITCNADGAANQVYRGEDNEAPWITQSFVQSPYGNGELVVNTPIGGAWFVLTDNPACIAGADLKVLLAQITTDGDICGVFNLQVFPQFTGAGSESITQTLNFGTSAGCVPGCIDWEAVNFNPNATFENGNCLFPCALTIDSYTTTPPFCTGDANGVIELTISGNQDYVEYSLNNAYLGVSENNHLFINSLAEGVYTITVSDTRFDNPLANPNGLTCEVSQSFSVDVQDLYFSGSSAIGCRCSDSNDGQIITPSGNYSTGPGIEYQLLTEFGDLMFLESGPAIAATPNFSGLPPGSYYIQAINASGCSLNGELITITAPSPIYMEASAIGIGNCSNSTDVTKIISWFGGTGDVDFSLNNDGTFPIEGNATNVVLSLSVGSHVLYAMDANGCETSLSFSVLGPPPLSFNTWIQEPSCNGINNGILQVDAFGGTGNIQISYNDVVVGIGSSIMTSLYAGIVEVSLTDDNGCSYSAPVEINQPSPLSALLEPIPVCPQNSEGGALVTPIGGLAPYSAVAVGVSGTNYYGEGFNSFFINTGWDSGNYDFVLTDANGCTWSSSFTIPSTGILSVVGPNSAPFNSTQTYTATGVQNGAYFWSISGGSIISGQGQGSVTVVWGNFGPGVIEVQFSDNLCSQVAFLEVELSCINPGCTDPLACNYSSNATCNDNSCSYPGCMNPLACNYNPSALCDSGNCLMSGCSDVQACNFNPEAACNDGSCVYSNFNVMANLQNPSCFGLNNGQVTLIINNAQPPINLLWNNGSTATEITNLPAGEYAVVISDAFGCINDYSFTLTAPAPLQTNLLANDVTCFGENDGSAFTAISGGTPPYSIQWSSQPIETGNSISNLSPGIYAVYVTDANGCSSESNFNINQPDSELTVLITGSAANCNSNNGSAQAVVSGNSGSINYLWNTGQTTPAISNLNAGIYSVTVTQGACSAEASFAVNNINGPSISSVYQNPSCFGGNDGSITIAITGGTLPYQYLWSNGFNGTSQSQLSEGDYTLLVLDAEGCQATNVFSLEQPEPIIVDLLVTPTTCNGSPTGMIESTVSGGTAPYAYTWSNGSTAASLINLEAGNYSLTITDANACSAVALSNVITESGVTATSFANNVTCPGGNNGSVQVIATQGSPPYSYTWNTGTTGTANLDNLTAGIYTCLVSDVSGCNFTVSAELTEPAGNVPSILGDNQVEAFSTGTYSTPDTPGLTYSWTITGGNILTGQGSSFIQVQWGEDGVGGVVLTVADASDCTVETSLEVIIGSSAVVRNPQHTLLIFPNPFRDFTTIRAQGVQLTKDYLIYDTVGNVVESGTINNESSLIVGTYLSSGLYFIHFDNVIYKLIRL